MGLLRDTIGSALSGPSVNNGLNGRKLPLRGSRASHNDSRRPSPGSTAYRSPEPRRRDHKYDQQEYGTSSPYDSRDNNGQWQYQRDAHGYRYEGEGHYPGRRQYSAPERRPSTSRQTYQPSSPQRRQKNEYEHQEREIGPPPSYSLYPVPSSPARLTGYSNDDEGRRSFTGNNAGHRDDYRDRQGTSHPRPRSIDQSPYRPRAGRDVDRQFRPLALPQIDYHDSSPFLRGYSDELQRYGISERAFLEVLDAINVARIPNPEVKLFQAGATIAGFFVPGAAAIGLMAGQVGVGLASHFGHASLVNRVLSKANLNMFIPNGLEICICKAKDVDGELGLSPNDVQMRFVPGSYPQDKVAAYGDLLAPLTSVLGPAQSGGRNDPIAGVGKFLNNRSAQRKVKDAQKNDAEGKDKGMSHIENSLKWIMVRKASPGAVEHWQMTLRKSDQEAEAEQAQAQQHTTTSPRNRHR
ncbi:hypothetical protein PV08_10116 [Exophiala spinifera]|uniref:Uncharacterized protein n=1 Tax=Exophiala spinifera TaxID=91928 RepID=A0A0D1ZCP9_9EURO|nr:uncharacterized protein PV08_10116 [Exophiala spinifera]KIW10817.1 hypothetical protein PV08_10116 [Exophiala spinifera]